MCQVQPLLCLSGRVYEAQEDEGLSQKVHLSALRLHSQQGPVAPGSLARGEFAEDVSLIFYIHFCAHHFCPERKLFTFSQAHSHASTNATRCHEYFPGLSRLFCQCQEFWFHFLSFIFWEKWPFWLWEGALSLSKSPPKVKRVIFTRKRMR